MGLALGVPPFFFLPNKSVLLDVRMASDVDGANAHDNEMRVRQTSEVSVIAALDVSLGREGVAMVQSSTYETDESS